jgi:hypothetical protein
MLVTHLIVHQLVSILLGIELLVVGFGALAE